MLMVTCNDCGVNWVKYCPFCKAKNISWDPSIKSIKPKTQKSQAINKPKEPVPDQPLPVTIDNFFIATRGVFEELSFIPGDVDFFFKSKTSAYYKNADGTVLVRVSDHWGHKIRFCSWHLKDYPQISSWKWQKEYGKKQRVGRILVKHLKPNYGTPEFQRMNLESRHPID